MSAWDVAGAVVWTSCAGLLVLGIAGDLAAKRYRNGEGFFPCVFAVGFAWAGVYCIARIFGAHT